MQLYPVTLHDQGKRNAHAAFDESVLPPRATRQRKRNGETATMGAVPQEERYWHTTTAGTGKETGVGFRAGCLTTPDRHSSPTRSAFHPEREFGEPSANGITRRKSHPVVKPEFPETGANLGDKDVYRHERVGTALWSSVLEQMPKGRDVAADGMNSNHLGANLGDPKVHVDERLGTLLHSSSLDHFASGIKTPSRAPSEMSVRSAVSSKVSTTKELLAKVQDLEAQLAAEKKKNQKKPLHSRAFRPAA